MPTIATHQGIAHPWLCDALGHLAARHFAAAFDDATWHLYAAALGVTPGPHTAMLWADAKATIEYRASLAPGELFVIQSCFGMVGRTSLTSIHCMYSTSGIEIARQEVVSVQVDRLTGKPAPISEEIRHRISQFTESGSAE